MPVKSMVTGIVLIFMVFFLVYFVEFFLPLSVKADIDMLCRSTLLRMENEGGLSIDEKRSLQTELEKAGLTDVIINASAGAKQGGVLSLNVAGDYTYNRITGLFKREDVVIKMVYSKTAMSRKVVN